MMKITVLVLIGLLAAGAVVAAEPVHITISIPGPRNLTFLPFELISAIGADQAEGASVRILHTASGSTAIQELVTMNADFASAALPAALSYQTKGGEPLAVIATISDAPLYVLMVRSDLKNRIHSVKDLKGSTIGVNASSLSTKTASQQLAEIALKKAGVPIESVRFIATGQTWEAQSSMLKSRTVDAIMGDEPFASRLRDAGLVFFLLNLADPSTTRDIPGSGFLRAALITRAAAAADDPVRAERMVKIVKRTLAWMAAHSSEEIVTKLNLADADERKWIIRTLKQYPRMYSRDGMFSSAQLKETERFFAETSGKADIRTLLDSMINTRWAGRRN
jgi:NitT/TauT family transport system substrate-binding protein